MWKFCFGIEIDHNCKHRLRGDLYSRLIYVMGFRKGVLVKYLDGLLGHVRYTFRFKETGKNWVADKAADEWDNVSRCRLLMVIRFRSFK